MSIAAVTSAIFLSTATAAGYAVMRLLGRGLSNAETVAWSFITGLLTQAFIEVSLLAAHLLPGPKKILAAEALVVAGSFLYRRRAARSLSRGAPKWEPVTVFLLMLSAIGAVLFFCIAATETLVATDFFAIWGLKGRMIFATGAIPSRIFHDPALYWDHPEYPMLVPLSFAAVASAARTWDDRALAIFYPFCQVATILALWGLVSRRVSREVGAFAACLTAVCFPLYAASNLGMAEIPMALGFVLLASAASDALISGGLDCRGRLALASLMCAATKQEGTLFAFLITAWLFLRRRSASQRMLWLWAGVPAFFHGVALRLWRGPAVRRDFDLTFLSPPRWKELETRLETVVRHILAVEARPAILAIAAIVLFLALTRRGCADWLAFVVAGQILFYAFVCALSAFGELWLLEASFRRIVTSLIPTAILVLSCRLLPEAPPSMDAEPHRERQFR